MSFFSVLCSVLVQACSVVSWFFSVGVSYLIHPSLPVSTALWWLSTTAKLHHRHWQWEGDDTATAQQLGHLSLVQVHPTREEIQRVSWNVDHRMFFLSVFDQGLFCICFGTSDETHPKIKYKKTKWTVLTCSVPTRRVHPSYYSCGPCACKTGKPVLVFSWISIQWLI